MDDVLRDLIHKNLNLRETEDLIEIWRERDTDEYQEEVFDILRTILLDRLGYLPPQSNRAQIEQSLRQIEGLLEAEDLEEALDACEALIRLAPDSAAAFHYRGVVHDELGKFEQAIKDYRTAVQLDPELDGAWEDFLSVEQDIELEFQESRSKHYLDNALAFAYEGEREGALAEIELARRTMPAIASVYNYLGQVFGILDQLESAIEAYQIAVQLNPRYYEARENLANARVNLEENRYLEKPSGTLEASPDYSDSELLDAGGDDRPVPGWIYLDEKGFLLPGWPGHRTRPGRSGYDPLDSDFEYAQMQGRILRMLFTIRMRTYSTIYLLFMTLVGLMYSLPMLLTIATVLNGELRYVWLMAVFSVDFAVGLALLANVAASVQNRYNDGNEYNGSAFF